MMMMMTEHAVRKLLCLRASVGVEPACVWYSVQKASHAPCVRPRADLRHAGSSVGERERERGSVATVRNIPLCSPRAAVRIDDLTRQEVLTK